MRLGRARSGRRLILSLKYQQYLYSDGAEVCRQKRDSTGSIYLQRQSLRLRRLMWCGIERFHLRGWQPWTFIRNEESVYVRKELNSLRIRLGHQHGRGSSFWYTNMAAVTSRQNAPAITVLKTILMGRHHAVSNYSVCIEIPWQIIFLNTAWYSEQINSKVNILDRIFFDWSLRRSLNV